MPDETPSRGIGGLMPGVPTGDVHRSAPPSAFGRWGGPNRSPCFTVGPGPHRMHPDIIPGLGQRPEPQNRLPGRRHCGPPRLGAPQPARRRLGRTRPQRRRLAGRRPAELTGPPRHAPGHEPPGTTRRRYSTKQRGRRRAAALAVRRRLPRLIDRETDSQTAQALNPRAQAVKTGAAKLKGRPG